jgi:hypothetical protein
MPSEASGTPSRQAEEVTAVPSHAANRRAKAARLAQRIRAEGVATTADPRFNRVLAASAAMDDAAAGRDFAGISPETADCVIALMRPQRTIAERDANVSRISDRMATIGGPRAPEL